MSFIRNFLHHLYFLLMKALLAAFKKGKALKSLIIDRLYDGGRVAGALLYRFCRMCDWIVESCIKAVLLAPNALNKISVTLIKLPALLLSDLKQEGFKAAAAYAQFTKSVAQSVLDIYSKQHFKKIDLRKHASLFEGALSLCLMVMIVMAVQKTDVLSDLKRLADNIPEFRMNTATAAKPYYKEKPFELNTIVAEAGDENAVATEPAEKSLYEYEAEEPPLKVEGVLVPQKSTVISSSRDGKINHIYFDDGDLFQKGDILITYVCDDLKAEMEAVETEGKFFDEKGTRGEKLFKLDIISEVEKMDLDNEVSKVQARRGVLQARMQNCVIRAVYDGRVVSRLANDNEYTRTDRVLMEVASTENGHVIVSMNTNMKFLKS